MIGLEPRFTAITGSPEVAEALLARYREPHRRYHTVEHLRELLALVDELAAEADDPVAVELAAWYHDAVHDPVAPAGSSEARSADLAVEELTALGRPPSLVEEVRRLVLLTAQHIVEPGDGNGAVLADADLAILGAAPERYDRYAADVAAEYAHLGPEAWAAGRAAVLDALAARHRLFHTDLGRERFEAAARTNIARERATLA
jgi:predicted metal-dependent HD superfamily phosphohydrolase